LGYSNVDIIAAENGVAVGAYGSEVLIIDPTGNITVPASKTITLTTGQFPVGQKFVVTYPQVAAADVAKTFFIAPAACKIISGYERHVTVAGQAGVLTVEKLTTGEAPSAGDDLFTTGWDLTSTANTPVSKTAVTTAAGTLAAGDALCLKVQSGAATSYALGTVSVVMQWV